MVDREELCSTQVEPSSSQTSSTPVVGAINEPIQRQTENSHSGVQASIPRADNPATTSGLSGSLHYVIQPRGSISPEHDQDQHSNDDTQSNDRGQANGQDEDQNDEEGPPKKQRGDPRSS